MNQSQPKDGRPKLGAPTLYKPEYCDQLIDHMKSGYSFESFAAIIDVVRATLYNWTKDFPEFLDAKNRGVDHSLLFFEKNSIGIATGKVPAFGQVTNMFIMKCRFRDIYNDSPEDPDKDFTIRVIRDVPKSDRDSDIASDAS